MKRILFLITAIMIFISAGVSAEFVIDEKVTETPVTKGVTYTHIKKLTENGWSNLHLLKADMKEEGVGFKVLFNESLTVNSTVEQFAKADSNVVAAINADFFTNYSGKNASEGMIISNGEFITSPSNDVNYATIGIDENKNIFTDYFKFRIVVKSESTGNSSEVQFYNKVAPVSYLKIYDRNFGTHSPGSMDDGCEVVVKDGVVESINSNKEGLEIPENGYVISNSLRYSMFLADNFNVGDKVTLDISLTPEIDGIKEAVGGGTVLVKEGKKVSFTLKDARNPITAAGYDSKNKILYFLNADGRNEKARGMTFNEAAEFFISYGCTDAVSFDGGGSTAMAVKKPGRDTAHVNIQSYYRPVTNAIGITAEKKHGELAWISADVSANRIRLSESVKLQVYAYDEYMNNMVIEPTEVVYSADKKGRFEGNVFYPEQTGKVTLKASYRGVENKAVITVMENKVSEDYEDMFYKSPKKEGYTVGFFGDNGNLKTLFTNIATAKRNSLAGETDVSVFRQKPSGNITSDVKSLSVYSQFTNEYGAFVSLNNNKGSVTSTDSSQWSKFISFIGTTDKKNIFIMLPVSIEKNDVDETEILLDKIKANLSGRNIFIISYGENYSYNYDDGIRYISMRDIPAFNSGNPYETLELLKYGLFTFTEDDVSFEFVSYFE